jgi:hypothetical protein
MLGCSGKLYAALLNEEHKVGVFALVKDFLIVFGAGGGSAGCSSSDNLRPIRHFENGGSGSSGVRV